MSKLHCADCRNLREQLESKDKHIKELESKVLLLEYDLKEIRQKWFGRRKNKSEDIQEDSPKKLGAPLGHPGWFRRKPDKVDVVEQVRLDQCPDCGSKDLKKCTGTTEHIQEDIILPRLRVTQYVHHRYWCHNCGKVVSAIGKDEMPSSYIGPQAKSLAAYLKYVVKVSQRDIQKIFVHLCGLKIVPSTIPGFHNQATRKAMPLYEGLKDQIKKSRVVHADETGCLVDGKNRWDWVFGTSKICLHAIRASRGSKIVQEILGDKYNGILVSDFYGAYNNLEAKGKQRCLVHLLRDLKKALECSREGEITHIYCQRLKDTILGAIALSEQRARRKITEGTFQKKRQDILTSLQDLQFPDPGKGIIRRLSKRLERYKNEMFTFLYHPGVPYHNNHAEQLIRPSVMLRKITFGCRSEKGVENHNVLMSILQTAKLNRRQGIPVIKKILTNPKQIPLKFYLGP